MQRRYLSTMITGLVASIALIACGNAQPTVTTSPEPSTTSPTESTTSSATAAPSTTTPPTIGRKMVVLDPGHNGGNSRNKSEINKVVPAGRGRGKPCNTTGTQTNSGYPEHAFTWDVANRIKKILTAKGIRVELTRPNDNGVGPCVNERAGIANRAKADAVVSIHADGSLTAGHRGFHIIYSSPPLNAFQGEPSLRLASTVRDAMRDAGIPLSNYLGKAGLNGRDDIAGLNLSERPAIMVECANMRNSAEAALVSTPEGRQQYAAAIADGLLKYLDAL